ncbi:MAG TPA: hypothetical protein VHQ47_07120 [Phycisphaerae bacterium]|nr:hypothetical protein [Phycisphaerae bacterium]
MRIAIPMRAALAAASLLTASRAVGQTPAPVPLAATRPANSAAALEARWSTLLDRLASDSFQVRQDAQKEVDQATPRDLSALKILAATVTDPEVKARLLARVDALDVQALLNPPPIDFDVDNGSIQDVADALGKATGLSWRTFRQGGPPQLFTLHAKAMPLWDVFMALNAQHGLRFESGGDLELWLDARGPRRGDLEGPLLFFPQTLAKVVDLDSADQAPDDSPASTRPPPPHFEFSYGVIGDPRLKIAKAWPSEITEVLDDKGNVLLRNAPQNNASTAPLFLQQQTTAIWPVPDGLGKTITIKGTMKLSFIISETTVLIPDMITHGNAPIVLGDEQVVWDKFEPNKDKGIDFQVSIQKKGGGPIAGEILPVRITLTDGTGRHGAFNPLQGSLTGGFGFDPANGPITGAFSIPNRIVDRTFNFQFKDIPIP